jgi:hypothetical protein
VRGCSCVPAGVQAAKRCVRFAGRLARHASSFGVQSIKDAIARQPRARINHFFADAHQSFLLESSQDWIDAAACQAGDLDELKAVGFAFGGIKQRLQYLAGLDRSLPHRPKEVYIVVDRCVGTFYPSSSARRSPVGSPDSERGGEATTSAELELIGHSLTIVPGGAGTGHRAARAPAVVRRQWSSTKQRLPWPV